MLPWGREKENMHGEAVLGKSALFNAFSKGTHKARKGCSRISRWTPRVVKGTTEEPSMENDGLRQTLTGLARRRVENTGRVCIVAESHRRALMSIGSCLRTDAQKAADIARGTARSGMQEERQEVLERRSKSAKGLLPLQDQWPCEQRQIVSHQDRLRLPKTLLFRVRRCGKLQSQQIENP